MPSFRKVLLSLHEAFHERSNEVAEQASQFDSGLKQLARHGLGGEVGTLTTADVRQAGLTLLAEVDRVHGGFGGAPKFPNPMNVSLLLRAFRHGAGAATRDAALHTLEKMALGGIYDQLGAASPCYLHRMRTAARPTF